jgi:cytochrome b
MSGKADPVRPAGTTGARQPPMARVWDPLVRLFHWSLVASFVLAWFTPHRSETIHSWAGYAAAGLIGLRLVWGIVGTRHARFSSFVRRPGEILAYLMAIARGTEARHIGHNPAGGAMILALIAGMAGIALTGWLMYTDRFYGDDGMVALHSTFAHALLVLILLHLAGVALASLRHRENLPLAMVTGVKRPPAPGDVD